MVLGPEGRQNCVCFHMLVVGAENDVAVELVESVYHLSV